jgi:hypothetical protein
MIEVVAFATPNSIQFLRDLQVRTMALVANGLDAMLHWGLENDRVTGDHLRKTRGLRRPSAHPDMSRLDTFKAVRGLVRAASAAPFTAFDNAFTARMWLDEEVAEADRAKVSRVRAALVFIESYRELPLLAWPRAVIVPVIV